MSLSCSPGLIASALGLSEKKQAVQINRLCRYSEGLERWSKVHRLVGWKKASLFATEGLADAWALLDLLGAGEFQQIVDLGSGAGLPGVVLSIASPEQEIHLVEPRRKRVSFLREMRRVLELDSLHIHHGREEDVRKVLPSCGKRLVMARAFRAPEEVLKCAAQWNAVACVLSLRAGREVASASWKSLRSVDGRPVGTTSHQLFGRQEF